MAYKKVRIFVRLMNNYMTKNVFFIGYIPGGGYWGPVSMKNFQ